MAKSLQERLASARATDRTTIETLAKLIDDVGAEKTRLSAAHEQASAESIDFALAANDREEAAANAARYARDIEALSAAAVELDEKLEAKRNSDAHRAKAAERAAALGERDEIAARFKDRVPLLTAELIELLQEVDANAERMRLAGVKEVDAEFHARGIPGNGMIGAAPAPRFTKIKIPEFNSAARAWPIDQFDLMNRRVHDEAARNLRAQKAAAEARREQEGKAADEHACNHGQYQVAAKPDRTRRTPIFIDPALREWDMPDSIGNMNPWRGELPVATAAKLEQVDGLIVTRLDAGSKK